MQLFYSEHIEGDLVLFDEQESLHITKVLRKEQGETIASTDGCGNRYTGHLEVFSKKKCGLRVENKETIPSPNYLGHIAIAPTKNLDRMTWFVEKSVEIGIAEITFFIAEHSERRKLKLDKIKKNMIAAMKQSNRYHLPVLNEVLTFEELVKGNSDSAETKLIAHCNEDDEKRFMGAYVQPNTPTLVLIGPEGDFSDNEIALAKKEGFLPISISEYRLRTETAALFTNNFINFVNLAR